MNDEQVTSLIMELQKAIAALQQDVKAAFRRIDEHTKLVESVHSLALAVQEHTGELKRLSEHQAAMRADLDELKARPTKRWDTVITAGITGIVAFVVAWFTRGGG